MFSLSNFDVKRLVFYEACELVGQFCAEHSLKVHSMFEISHVLQQLRKVNIDNKLLEVKFIHMRISL